MNYNEMLLDGARDGKIELVEYALKKGADVNTGIYCMETLYTPLRLAIKNGANPINESIYLLTPIKNIHQRTRYLDDR